jgi:hypothetical protein
MEKVDGIPLEQVWNKIQVEDHFAIVKQVATYQRIWASVRFTSYGSLYFSESLNMKPTGPLYIDETGKEVYLQRFCIGPSNGREFVDDGRIAVDFFKGPCNTPRSPFTALY